MARSVKSNIAKKIAIIAIPLIIIQTGYLFLFSKSEPVSVQLAIDNAVRKVSKADDRRKALLKIQLAVANYMQTKDGKPPASLDELRPTYFDIIPNDPATGRPFSYKVEGNRWSVGFDIAEAFGTRGKGKVEPKAIAPVETIEPIRVAFVYDTTGKRDPFRPFDFAPKLSISGKTPLERYEYGQLKLTAVVLGMGEPKAVIENAVGRGYTATKGTKVGLYGGQIVDIQKDKVLILEDSVDFTGEKKNKTIELRLRTKDQEKKTRMEEQ